MSSQHAECNDTCPMRDRNRTQCPCTNTECDNHGRCCDCIAAHRLYKSPPACMKQFARV